MSCRAGGGKKGLATTFKNCTMVATNSHLTNASLAYHNVNLFLLELECERKEATPAKNLAISA